MYGKDGLVNKKGRNAFEFKGQFDDSYKSKYDEIVGSLSNDSQKAKFQQMADRGRGVLQISKVRCPFQTDQETSQFLRTCAKSVSACSLNR
jgi:hypothetical protein